jgi:hypothetical chaperone protein
LAIDFGTSNSLVAAATRDRVLPPLPIDPHHQDPTILRSVLFSPRRNEWESGAEAISLYYDYGAEGRIFRSLKKFLPDPSFQGTQVHGQFHSLEDLLSRLLRTIRTRAEQHLGQMLDKVMLGHPALFSAQADRHEQALLRLDKAARLAGFTEIQFCPEPLAAAHQFASAIDRPRTVLIADFGGGTSDFTLVRMRPEGFKPEDVLALGGLSVAGDAFDGSIMEHDVAPHFGSKISYKVPFGSNVMQLPRALVRKMCSPADLLLLARQDYMEFFHQLDNWSLGQADAQAIERLRTLIEERQGYQLFQSIEDGKKGLSGKTQTQIVYDYPDIGFDLPLSKPRFQTYSQVLVDSIVKVLDETIKSAGLSPSDIDIVCCTGGTARLEALQDALSQRFGVDKLEHHLPFHAVVQGLARRAQQWLAST